MALHLRSSRKLPLLCKTKQWSIFFSRNGSDGDGEGTVFGLRGVQGKQAYGSRLSLRFLFCSSARSNLGCADNQVPSLLSHSFSLCTIREGLPLIRPPFWASKCRPFCNDLASMSSDSEDETDEPCVVDGVKSEIDQREVERVCNVIDETFAVDRNMEAVLDEIRVNLSRELVVAVLERYKQARKPAFRFFSWASSRPGFDHDALTYNALMSILGKARQFETMLSLLGEMGDKGLLTIETFTICIRVFAAAKERRKAVGMIDIMRKYNFKVDVEIINCLLEALGRAKLAKEAHVLFEKLEEKFSPNLRTYTVLLSAWCRVKNLMEAGKIWNEMIDSGFMPDIVAHNVMLEGLIRGKKRSDAVKLFEIMRSKGPHPNVRSYTVIVLDLCKRRLMDEAVTYFDEMVSCGFKPDAAIYTCLMTGFGNRNQMDAVYNILEEMKVGGCPPDGKTYNTLIKMMTSRKKLDDAVRIYHKMIRSGIHPSLHTYHMMMKAYFVAKDYDMGFAVWEEMKRKGCCPDENTYTIMIGSVIRLGRWMEACQYLEEMTDKGMRAPRLDYSKFRADFSRLGKPSTLERLMEKMRYNGNHEVADVLSRWLNHRTRTS